jgi:hypothetical protein
VPEDVLVVNYIGVPVTGSVSSLGGRGFYYMKKFGPNDGITLLPDALFPGGVTVVELGRDHFLLDAEIGATTVALVTTVIDWLEDRETKAARIR